MIAGEAQQRIESLRDERRLPVRDVVRVEIRRRRPAIARRKIFSNVAVSARARANDEERSGELLCVTALPPPAPRRARRSARECGRRLGSRWP